MSGGLRNPAQGRGVTGAEGVALLGRVRGAPAPSCGATVRPACVRAAMAATFFGEVVKAPCRAGTEDEDEDDDGRKEIPEDREVRRQLARKR